LQIVNQTYCASRFSKIKSVEITETKICAFDPSGAKDACQGLLKKQDLVDYLTE
jgi:hypothetical protein